MGSIADTIRRLQAARPRLADTISPSAPSRMRPIERFGSNPGELDGWCYVPDAIGPVPLVVVLHGCTQTARGYDHGSGWSDLAERSGFAVLFPEQRRANNHNLCFNWFREQDAGIGGAEVLSIRQMVEATIRTHAIDASRVFVTGLSAGGAMANAMLATCPDLFAGGAIVAGLPFGSAGSVIEALARMRGSGHASAAEYVDAVRRTDPGRTGWPRVTVWHGDADATVSRSNGELIVEQWRGVHGLGATPDRVDEVDGHQRRTWFDRDGGTAVAHYSIKGLGHGLPISPRDPDGVGTAGAFMIDAGISSTWLQAESWGLIGESRATRRRPGDAAPRSEDATGSPGSHSVEAVIERALRSAGLMR